MTNSAMLTMTQYTVPSGRDAPTAVGVVHSDRASDRCGQKDDKLVQRLIGRYYGGCESKFRRVWTTNASISFRVARADEIYLPKRVPARKRI